MSKNRSLNAAKRAQAGQKKKTAHVNRLLSTHPVDDLNLSAAKKTRSPCWQDDPLISMEQLFNLHHRQLLNQLSLIQPPQGYLLLLSYTPGDMAAKQIQAHATSPEAALQALQTQWSKKEKKPLNQYKVRWARLDWVVESTPLSDTQLSQQLQASTNGYYPCGLGLDADLNYLFLAPELHAHAMIYPGSVEQGHWQAALNPPAFQAYAQKKYGNKVPLSFNPGATFYQLTTQGCLLTAQGCYDLPATQPVRTIPQLDAEHTQHLINASSRFLAAQIQPNGRFVYGILPYGNKTLTGYNAMRHVGALYSLLDTWNAEDESELLPAIERGIQYATKKLTATHTINDTSLSFLVDGEEIKAGGVGLYLLMLVKYTELTQDHRHQSLMEQLAEALLYLQQPDGSFIHVLEAKTLATKEVFRTIYYDGEATFGLISYYRLTQNPRWLQANIRAFDYFCQQNHWKSHDHWLAYAVNELTRYVQDDRYLELGLKNIFGHLDFILERETYYPTLGELVMASHQLIQRIAALPDKQHLLKRYDLQKFYRALEYRMHYLAQGFYWPEIAMFTPDPARLVGSFYLRHHALRTRIDDVQHYLSGYVAYLRYYLPEPYVFIAPNETSSLATEAQTALFWNQAHVQLATQGAWVSLPQNNWSATGVSIAEASLVPRHMVAVKGSAKRGGIPTAYLPRLKDKISALIVEEDNEALRQLNLPLYQVPSVLDAVMDFGRYARQQFLGKVVGVTGSAGKTSSVQMIQQLLSHWGNAEASRLSANLPHGIAWNLASMDWQASFYVIEMAIGRMHINSQLAKPDVAVFLNVGPAHLEYHKTTEQIAIKKSRIFGGMKPGQYAVINRDMDEWPIVEAAAKRNHLEIISFGTHVSSDIRWLNHAALVPSDGALVKVGGQETTLPLAGQGAHIVMNILAALGVMASLDLPIHEVIPEMQNLSPPEGRGQERVQPFGEGSVTFVDDAYNANPLSMKAMLSQLALRQVAGTKHLILADMLELGDNTADYHRELLPYISASGAGSVTLLGEQMHKLAPELKDQVPSVYCAENSEQASIAISAALEMGDLVIAKGSNKFKLSQLLANLNSLSYCVFDSSGQLLLDFQSFLPFRPASLTKLVTAMVVLDNCNDLSEVLEVISDDLVSGSGANLQAGDKITVIDALHNLLIPSSNQAAQVLARYFGGLMDASISSKNHSIAQFVKAMNYKVASLGATRTMLANPSGLNQRDMQSTAADIMLIAQSAIKYPLISEILSKKDYLLTISGQHQRLLKIQTRLLPIKTLKELSLEIEGGKTGTLVGAAENLFIKAKINDKPVMAVLLQNGFDRYRLMAELLAKFALKLSS